MNSELGPRLDHFAVEYLAGNAVLVEDCIFMIPGDPVPIPRQAPASEAVSMEGARAVSLSSKATAVPRRVDCLGFWRFCQKPASWGKKRRAF